MGLEPQFFCIIFHVIETSIRFLSVFCGKHGNGALKSMLFSCLFDKALAQSIHSSIGKFIKASELFADYFKKPTVLQRGD